MLQTHYKVVEFTRNSKVCRKYVFGAGEHTLTEPIELDDFDCIQGDTRSTTVLKVKGSFPGPFIRTKNLKQNCEQKNWFHHEGVPVRFSIQNLTIDLEEWTPEKDSYDFNYASLSFCAIGLYGKSFLVNNLTVLNAPGTALISIGPNKGGQKTVYLDAPEAKLSDIEITNTIGDGIVFAGPHDSMLDNLIISRSRKKGVSIIADQYVNGACDIGFIHAYATDDIAIDISAKVKARFLQADTGKGGGIKLHDNAMSVVDMIEVFKTRRNGKASNMENYGLIVDTIEAQIGLARIRADAGADGVLLSGAGNTISNLHITAGKMHENFKHLDKGNAPKALVLNGHANAIIHGRIIKAQIQPIHTIKRDGEKYFNGNFSIDYSSLPENTLLFSKGGFVESSIVINNKPYSGV